MGTIRWWKWKNRDKQICKRSHRNHQETTEATEFTSPQFNQGKKPLQEENKVNIKQAISLAIQCNIMD